MNPFDLTDTLETMTILVDTREQDTTKARRRYASFGVPWRREKLDWGDYSAEFTAPNGKVISLNSNVAVERKMSLDELCHCFCQDRGRFEREFNRAKKLYLLIEGASWESIYAGRYRSKMTAKALVASLLAYTARYNCVPQFCEPGTSGRLIKDILYREGKEFLESLPYEGDKEVVP